MIAIVVIDGKLSNLQIQRELKTIYYVLTNRQADCANDDRKVKIRSYALGRLEISKYAAE